VTLGHDPELGNIHAGDFGPHTDALTLPMFGGAPVVITFDDLEWPVPEPVRRAAVTFVNVGPDVLRTPRALEVLRENYEENRDFFCPQGLPISRDEDLWGFVTPEGAGVELDDEDRPHVVLECDCAWELEHRLQLVFRDGGVLTRISQSDGDLTGPNGDL
jgi:hypothetical protein